MQQMPRLGESAEPASCRGRKSSVVFFTPLPCHFSLFFFPAWPVLLWPWCRVPRAWRWNSNMDHLTPVKTALLVERQALSACRGKCYAASQFSPSFTLSLPLFLSRFPFLLSLQNWLTFPLHRSLSLSLESLTNSLSSASHLSLFLVFSHLAHTLTFNFTHLSSSFFSLWMNLQLQPTLNFCSYHHHLISYV